MGPWQKAIGAVLLVAFVVALAWRIYVWETTGEDPAKAAMAWAFADHAGFFVPLTFGFLAAGLLLSLRRYLRNGTFGIKPVHAVLLVIVLAIFGWAKLLA